MGSEFGKGGFWGVNLDYFICSIITVPCYHNLPFELMLCFIFAGETVYLFEKISFPNNSWKNINMKEESCIKASTCKLIAFQDKETFIEELILKFGLFVELPFANINHSNRLQPLLGIDIESLHGSNPLIFVARIHHILKLQIIILANQ